MHCQKLVKSVAIDGSLLQLLVMKIACSEHEMYSGHTETGLRDIVVGLWKTLWLTRLEEFVFLLG
jgi:hypothetical protein